ncbi:MULTISPECIES: PEGA domain-containing protein [unclassified Methanoregula]|uniref:PEGA domain-containing protein n=1 Tax=unclassified Methanoregula TaxID=2649730 RepID=UPI0009CEEC03|nr:MULTISPECIES: PEGA domain-containing protein [unclassified Methanoregula]OPX65056.1 MAG: PEGA domain protein [Methanoregula sp. PtaB.Bin085]OPY32341.1 MAG: PEGA domain protein [Methanoregula sp. PtaU1.Bin006]
MSYTKSVILCCLFLACLSFFMVMPVPAFTADSLEITVQENGDGLATFRFTLEGLIENAIPQSILEEELTRGLSTGPEPPELKSMDRSTAVLLLKHFADTSDVPTGKEYRTATMDFKKAQAALKNSALSGAVTADFSPSTISLTFPDNFRKQYTNVDVLPAVFHTVEDPVKVARLQAEAEARAEAEAQVLAQALQSQGVTGNPAATVTTGETGAINVSSSPQNVKVSLDRHYIGESPALFRGITAGTHLMEFSKDGYATVTKSVLVNPGKTTNIMVVLTHVSSPAAAPVEDSSTSSLLPFAIILIGILVLCIGGYFFWIEKEKGTRKSRTARNNGTTAADARKPIPITILDDAAVAAKTKTAETPPMGVNGNIAAAGAGTPGVVAAAGEPAPTESATETPKPATAGAALAANTGADNTTMQPGTPDTSPRDTKGDDTAPAPHPAPEDEDTGDECR